MELLMSCIAPTLQNLSWAPGMDSVLSIFLRVVTQGSFLHFNKVFWQQIQGWIPASSAVFYILQQLFFVKKITIFLMIY